MFAKRGFALRAAVAFAVLTAASGVNRGADAADTKAACIEANTKGQDLRRDSHLLAARQEFLACADAACPTLVRDDCAHRLDELDAAQPTIVFEIVDRAGKDLAAVAVRVDGSPGAANVPGAAMRVDPGSHVFSFEAPGLPPVKKEFVLREGERQRLERVIVSGPPAAPDSPGAPPPDARKPSAPWRTVGLVVGGVGVATLVVGGVFGLEAIAKKNDASCPDNVCADQGHLTSLHDATSAANASTVLLIAGAALTAGGAALWLFAPRAPAAESGVLHVTPAIGLGSVALRGSW